MMGVQSKKIGLREEVKYRAANGLSLPGFVKEMLTDSTDLWGEEDKQIIRQISFRQILLGWVTRTPADRIMSHPIMPSKNPSVGDMLKHVDVLKSINHQICGTVVSEQYSGYPYFAETDKRVEL